MWDAIYDHLFEYTGAYMFLILAMLLFTGMPVAMALGGVSVLVGFFAIWMDFLNWPVFFQVIQRVWGGDGASGAVQNPILVAIPCFVFMGTMLEKSRVAEELLQILQVLLRRVPGGLALSVTVMGTILAATTGIIGASVVMMTLLALASMLGKGYSPRLATGTIAASATLGILIPPSIMLVLMANLLAVSVGNLFIGAIFPGLVLAGLYFLYILTVASIWPSTAPPMREDEIQLEPTKKSNMWLFLGIFAVSAFVAVEAELFQIYDDLNWPLLAFLTIFISAMWIGKKEGNTLLGGVLRGFIPPLFLIVMVLGSIFAGWATPTEAAGVGAFGSMVLAAFNKTLTYDVLKGVVHRTALTTAMIFFIFVGAVAFSTIFRNVYGEELIIHLIEFLELSPWALLFVLMFTIFLLGFFFDFLEITLIILPVFSPIIRGMAGTFGTHLGFDVEGGLNIAETRYLQEQVIYWFAILVAVNLQTSFLTPPFGFALFYMKGAAPSAVQMTDIYKGIIPFVLLQLIGLSMVLLFPGLALWLPEIVFSN
ncbi:MAG: TRAP transporter large permease subunit [Pseudomonadota bacterium]